MHIDSNKNNKQDIAKQNNQITKKIENAKTLNTANSLSVDSNPVKKDFAMLLKGSDNVKETRPENKQKEDTAETKTKENDKESKAKEEKSVREEKRDKSDSDDKSGKDNDKGFGQMQLAAREIVAGTAVPGARAMLHVADLERIISAIRSQNVANGKQISIELKRSVLEGLEVKLTIGKDKSISAEFIAGSEKIKSQLNARAAELAGVLRDRGINLTELKMSLSSDSDSNKERDNSEHIEQISAKNNPLQTESVVENDHFETSDTSYQV